MTKILYFWLRKQMLTLLVCLSFVVLADAFHVLGTAQGDKVIGLSLSLIG